MKRISQNNFGFTLFEMMVVIAVIGILGAIAGPNIGVRMQAYRFSASIRALQSAVQGARMEAIRRNATVGMEINAVGDTCMTFVDNDASGTWSVGDTELDILIMPNGVVIVGTLSGGDVIFNSRGMPGVSDRIVMKNPQAQFRGIDIGITGTSRIVRSGDGGTTWF